MKKFLALFLALVMLTCLFAGCAKDESEKGSVYFLNFKPEADSAWQTLAKTYTEKTGVPVKVVTAASGSYSETLTAEMAKDENAPTLFQCGNLAGLETWKEYCLALDGTDFLKEMTTDDFNLKGADGKTYCAGYCYEAFGIITNTALLEKAGYTVADITDFASLKKVAEDITARSAELGFSAFTSAGLDGSSSWRFSGHLANMPLYYEGVKADSATITGEHLDWYKNIWDLYINNSTCTPDTLATKTGDESEAEFATGKAVFFQNGTWEYANLVTDEKKAFYMNADDLAMLPIYCGADGEADAGICCGTENCWAVNAKASPANQKATLDFMKWVVTSDEGTKMMAEQFGPIPFKAAKESENVLFNDANKLMADGKYTVTWVFNYTPNVDDWRAGVVSALTAYSAGTGDWAAVETAFVAGWEQQYKIQNGG